MPVTVRRGNCAYTLSVDAARVHEIWQLLPKGGGKRTAWAVGVRQGVEGPTPECDGCFVLVRLRSSDRYETAFDFWHGSPDVTSITAAAGAHNDPTRSSNDTFVALPLAGAYDMEIRFESNAYTAMLASHVKLPAAKAPRASTVRHVKSWLTLHDNDACFASVPKTAIDRSTRFSNSAYWAYDAPLGKRYVPLQQPPFEVTLGSNVDNFLATHVPGGLVVVGSSRVRTMFYDIASMAGCDVSAAFKAHQSLAFRTPRGVELRFFWHDVRVDLGKDGGLSDFGHTLHPTNVVAKLGAQLDEWGICTRDEHLV